MNPFLTSGYVSSELFCDRETETKTIVSALENGRNILLFSIRRLGKSSLIDHVAAQLQETSKGQLIHIDLLSTQNSSDFATEIINAVMAHKRATSPIQSLAESILRSVVGSRFVFSTDALTGMPQVSLEPGDWSTTKKTLEAILNELEASKLPIVLALDEFQQIANYPEKGMLAEVRSLTQRYPNVRFIFSGSEESILTHLFTNPKQAFYNSAQLVQLKRIPEAIYFEFSKKHFGKTTLGKPEFQWIYDWCNGITFHVQWFCNRLFERDLSIIHQSDLEQTALSILDDFTFQFNAYQRLLTKDQLALLSAIATENRVFKPNSASFIATYNLKLPTNVQRSLKALLEKGLVQEDFDEENKKFYFISDVFLSRWLQRL